MDTKIKNIITSLVLLAAFFMPWVKVFGFGGSAFDLIRLAIKNIEQAEKEPIGLLVFLLLLFPICALIILINYAKSELKETQLGGIRFAKKTPLMLIIIAILYAFIRTSIFGDNFDLLGSFNLSDLLEVIGIGLILTLISSIVLFFDKTTSISNSKSDGVSNEPKEEINTDDIFK